MNLRVVVLLWQVPRLIMGIISSSVAKLCVSKIKNPDYHYILFPLHTGKVM